MCIIIFEVCRLAVGVRHFGYPAKVAALERAITYVVGFSCRISLGSPVDFFACTMVYGFFYLHRTHFLVARMAELAFLIDLPLSDNYFHRRFAIIVSPPETVFLLLPFAVVVVAGLRDLYTCRLTFVIEGLVLILYAVGVFDRRDVPFVV